MRSFILFARREERERVSDMKRERKRVRKEQT